MKMNQIKKLTVFFLMLSMSGANALAFEMQDMDMDKENSSAEYMQDTSNIDFRWMSLYSATGRSSV